MVGRFSRTFSTFLSVLILRPRYVIPSTIHILPSFISMMKSYRFSSNLYSHQINYNVGSLQFLPQSDIIELRQLPLYVITAGRAITPFGIYRRCEISVYQQNNIISFLVSNSLYKLLLVEDLQLLSVILHLKLLIFKLANYILFVPGLMPGHRRKNSKVLGRYLKVTPNRLGWVGIVFQKRGQSRIKLQGFVDGLRCTPLPLNLGSKCGGYPFYWVGDGRKLGLGSRNYSEPTLNLTHREQFRSSGRYLLSV